MKQIEAWRLVWRRGFAPHLSRKGLEALEQALFADDPSLFQCRTVVDNMNSVVCGACAIAYCGWKGDGLSSRDQIESYFSRVCDLANSALGHDNYDVSRFLNWFDDIERSEVRRELLQEVRLALNPVS